MSAGLHTLRCFVCLSNFYEFFFFNEGVIEKFMSKAMNNMVSQRWLTAHSPCKLLLLIKVACCLMHAARSRRKYRTPRKRLLPKDRNESYSYEVIEASVCDQFYLPMET